MKPFVHLKLWYLKHLVELREGAGTVCLPMSLWRDRGCGKHLNSSCGSAICYCCGFRTVISHLSDLVYLGTLTIPSCFRTPDLVF